MYGDSYLRVPFALVLGDFESSRKAALMTVFRNDGQWDASNVEFAEGKIGRYEKGGNGAGMRHIDYGLGIYSAMAFAGLPQNSVFDLSELQRSLIARDAMAGFEVKERFYEIGSAAGLAETDAFLSAGVLA